VASRSEQLAIGSSSASASCSGSPSRRRSATTSQPTRRSSGRPAERQLSSWRGSAPDLWPQ
jgi:hypothetical protein